MTAKKSDALVDYERDGEIVTLTLNRPEKLNAFSDELVGALSDALHRFDMDDEAHIAILNGRGRAFSSSASCAAARNSSGWADRRAAARTRPIFSPRR
ncbi:MAG: enoyl-CoA hydratase-related protein [Pseudolabrys sp.]|nr:enoyl-CoA hydratase-related protein [Pseudolabrys sp.]